MTTEFVEDMQNVTLDNAKIYFLQPDNRLPPLFLSVRTPRPSIYALSQSRMCGQPSGGHHVVLQAVLYIEPRCSVDLGSMKYKPIIESTSLLPARSGRSGSMIWRLRTSTRKTLSPAFFSHLLHRTCSSEVIRVMLTDSTGR